MIKKKQSINNDSGGELTDAPNEKYQAFFDKFSEIEKTPIQSWKTLHVLGYFCKRYYDYYKVKYQFKFNSPSPSKCYEVFQIKKMASMLSSSPEILVNYIDWVFATRVVNSNRRLTSIAFMTVESLLNEYKINILMAGKKYVNINRSTVLKPEHHSIVSKLPNASITTYGDLAFMYQAIEGGSFDSSPEFLNIWNQVLNDLENNGFNKSILGELR